MTSNTSVNNAAVATAGASNIDDILVSGNVAPTVAANPTSQTIVSGGTGNSAITITDENAATVTLSGSSSNTVLVPNGNISFSGSGATRTLTVTPAAGQTGTATITVTATDAGNLTGTATYTLTVNAPTITVSPAVLPAGTENAAYSQTITASGGTSPYTFAVTAGTLPNGLVLVSNGTLSGTPTTAGTYNFTITATDANNFSGSRTYTLTIAAAATPGTISFSAPTYTVTEGAATATITVTRTGGTDGAVSAAYTTDGGTATAGTCGGAGADYQATSGTVSFADASSASQTFTIPICTDAIYENAETVNLTLSNATGGATIGTGAATLTINDNNNQPAFRVSSVSANEGDSGTTSFTFTISKVGATALNSSVTYQTADGTATAPDDYTAIPATVLNFAPNDSDIQVTVLVNGDTTPEPNETFFVNLSNPTNATISVAQGTGTIINDEPSVATLAAPNCAGLAPTPLTAGSVNRAVICFALSSNTNANFTALNVPFSSNPAVKFTNPRLVSSVDTNYATAGDNVTVATGAVTTNQFTFTGFSAFAEARNGGIPSLTSTPTNFFVVADVLSTVDASTPAAQASVSTADVTVSNGTVTGTTATGQNYTFDLAVPTAADGVISGRVTSSRNNRGLENVTVTLSGGGLVQPIVVYTDQRGRYNFTEVPTGEIYTVTVASKRHTFNQPTTALSLTGSSENINFVGEGW